MLQWYKVAQWDIFWVGNPWVRHILWKCAALMLQDFGEKLKYLSRTGSWGTQVVWSAECCPALTMAMEAMVCYNAFAITKKTATAICINIMSIGPTLELWRILEYLKFCWPSEDPENRPNTFVPLLFIFPQKGMVISLFLEVSSYLSYYEICRFLSMLVAFICLRGAVEVMNGFRTMIFVGVPYPTFRGLKSYSFTRWGLPVLSWFVAPFSFVHII